MLTDVQSYYLLILPFLLFYLVGRLFSYFREFLKDGPVLDYIDYRLIPTLKSIVIFLLVSFPFIVFIDTKGLILSIITPAIVVGVSVTFIQLCQKRISDQSKLINDIREEKLIELNSNEVIGTIKKFSYYFMFLIGVSILIMIWCIRTILL